MATFGKTTNGANNTLHNSGRLSVSRAVLTEDAILNTGYMRSASNNATQEKHFKIVIYTDNAGAPGSLIWTSTEGAYQSTAAMFRPAAFSGEFLAAGTYWIGAIYDGNATTSVNIYRDNVAEQALTRTNVYASGAPDPIGTVVALAGKIDVYVEYTPYSVGTTGQVKVWTGSSFSPKPVKIWDGSIWSVKPVKRWDGSTWVITPY